MDLMFWLWAALLGLAAAAFAAAPFFLGGRVGIERAATLRALYRQRLDELDDETRSGLLEASERQAMEAELGRSLLSDFDDEEPAAKNSRSWAWLVAGLAAPLAAVALYLSIGEPDAPMLSGASHVLRLDPAEDRIELDRWRALLGHRVQRREDDAGSWFLLGRIYLADEDYAAAAAAFERAHALAGEDPAVDFHWLQARYLAAGGRLDEGAAAIAERILAQTPNQPMVLELLGLEAFRRADYREAVALFNRALANPLDPLPRRVLTTGFAEARARLGDLLPAVDVSVTAKAQPPEGATLFVIARPPGGGMPYAVLRRPASQLPDTFRLDDAVSMNPAAPLSMAEQVEVVVRISRAGTATAHPGDWQWRSKPLAVANAEAPIALQAELKPPS
ncbi:MAG: c-type cytochrome biogenesis protein CcmI [Gammaproteobacteria bacterium]|nr:c-type cytochrome biogenesis protein CcmI [Gammaproteobacteria bacterium]